MLKCLPTSGYIQWLRLMVNTYRLPKGGSNGEEGSLEDLEGNRFGNHRKS